MLTLRFRHETAEGGASWRGGWLVTADESSRPPSRTLVPGVGDPGGPRVVVRRPVADRETRSPVGIDVAFEPQIGNSIDLASLKVAYLAAVDLDITGRLAPYLTPSGIRAEGVELPPGDHTIEFAIRDAAGRRSVERLSSRCWSSSGTARRGSGMRRILLSS